MNKLSVLAFSLLVFFSSMSWYLANSSLNDYIKSQVLLQSEYYSNEVTSLVNASFAEVSGIASFNGYSLNNLAGLSQPKVLTVNTVSATLAKKPIQQLDSPSIQKKTTTLIHVEELRFAKVSAWSEVITEDGIVSNNTLPNNTSKTTSTVEHTQQTNIALFLERISTVLAKDYPALYPQLGAKIYAQEHPERSEELALAALDGEPVEKHIETNKAIIASNEAKLQKRLLGKATTRVKISSVIIEQLTLTTIKDNNTIVQQFNNVSLGSFGDNKGLASNQLGGELLKQIFNHLHTVDNNQMNK
ncbi:hypothetical protein [Colwellia sp. E2M01]|uniref:hypothetical protein n=1 Tax=Colwellia sp. E2M01 TaxID=2841561 RepID=UPI001C0A2B5B|nr:hypothetical protein [Colwellia sp. E2M01]MBU2869167.1 hypothetical protein [Colwellia sp. E2M01]